MFNVFSFQCTSLLSLCCIVQGSLEMFTGLGLILGPPLGGWLYQAYGYELPFLVLGCILLLMVPFNMIVMPSCGRGSTISVLDVTYPLRLIGVFLVFWLYYDCEISLLQYN